MSNARLMLLAASVVAIACHAGDATRADTANDQTDCILAGPRVSPSSATLHAGDTLRVTVSTAPCQGLQLTPYRWLSSDSTIAVVDSATGLIHARRAGPATIAAAYLPDPNVKGAMALQVVP